MFSADFRQNHFYLLARVIQTPVGDHNVMRLCTLCGVDAEDVTDMIAEIRTLTPKPGLAFGAEPVQPVVPDV